MNLWTRLREEEGSALVEVAFALPVLALVLAGTIDFGMYTERKMQMVEAANAAAAYGALSGNQLDVAGMQGAASSASPSLSGLTVTASPVWTCAPGSSAVSNTSNCGGYGTPIQYVKVVTSAVVNAPMPLAVLGSSFAVNGQATYRVRWKPS